MKIVSKEVLEKQQTYMDVALMSTEDVVSNALYIFTHDANVKKVLESILEKKEVHNRPAYEWWDDAVAQLYAYLLKLAKLTRKFLNERNKSVDELKECCNLLSDDNGLDLIKIFGYVVMLKLAHEINIWNKHMQYLKNLTEETEYTYFRDKFLRELDECIQDHTIHSTEFDTFELSILMEQTQTLAGYRNAIEEVYEERIKELQTLLDLAIKSIKTEGLEVVGEEWLRNYIERQNQAEAKIIEGLKKTLEAIMKAGENQKEVKDEN